MKRLIIFGMLVGLFCLTAQAVPTFRFTLSELQSFVIDTTSGITTSGYGGTLMQYDGPLPVWPDEEANPLSGEAGWTLLYGSMGTTGQLGIGTVVDLSTGSPSQISLTVFNDNQQNWSVALYAWDGTGTPIQSAFVPIAPFGDSSNFTLDITGLNPSGADWAGIVIKNNTGGPDTFHVSATIVPAPGAIVLGGIGVLLVGWLKRKRTL